MSWRQVALLLGYMIVVMGFVVWGGPWFFTVVGPVLSNVILGVPVAVMAVLKLLSQRREYRKIEAEGDPDPLRPPLEYEPAARGGRFFAWVIGGAFVVVNLALAWYGNYSILVPGLVVSGMLLAMGQEEVHHARAMDARLGDESAKGQ